MSFQCVKIFATLPKTERGKSLVFGADPKNQTFLYVNGNSVIIRNIEDPSDSDVYTQHAVATSVAKYSPSGFYIASADVSGKIRIWDTTQKEHILKNEFQPFAGVVKDLAWSNDNQRIVVGGEGREKFGAVFNAETGTSTGEIMGMSRPVNSVDFKSSRPFRLITGGEDSSCCFFEGPPFKFKTIHNDHTNFVNGARYAPSGDVFATGGADGKIFLYEGKTGELIGEIGDPAHKGGIYGICFSPDSKSLASVSGDKTLKIWSVDEPRSLLKEHTFENNVNNMQLGCVWIGSRLLTASLEGHVFIFDSSDITEPLVTLRGHNKPITALGYAGSFDRLITGCSDGGIGVWMPGTGQCAYLTGTGHKAQVQSMSIDGETLVTVGIDDKLIVSSLSQMTYGSDLQLTSQPRSVSVANGLIAVACIKEVLICEKGGIKSSLSVAYEPSTIAMSPDQSLVAVGSSQIPTLHVYSQSGGNLNPIQELKLDGQAMFALFSPNGQYLACADTDRKISLFSAGGGDGSLVPAHSEYWRFHAAKINCLAWSPSGERLASGSLDCSIIIWSVKEPKKRITITNAHPANQITGLSWVDENTLFSSGQDSNIRKWNIES